MTGSITNDRSIPSRPSVLETSILHWKTPFETNEEHVSTPKTENTYLNSSCSNAISALPQIPASTPVRRHRPCLSLIRKRNSQPSAQQPLDDHLSENKKSNMQIIEPSIDFDNKSDISPLQCGSIRPNFNYNPASDPLYQTFVPPAEITIRIKQPIPDWLLVDRSNTLDRRRSKVGFLKLADSSRSKKESAPKNNTIFVDGKEVALSPRRRDRFFGSNIFVGSIVGQSSFDTSPTDTSSSSDTDSQTRSELKGTPRPSSLVRRELKHFMNRVTLPFKTNDSIDLHRSARGCLV